MLMGSFDTNYVLNEHEDVDRYGSFAMPSEMVNQNEILIDSSY